MPPASAPAPWLTLGTDRGAAADLLARSVELLDEVTDGRPRLRWYVPVDAAIVLGRGQRDAKPVDGHEILQRPSGGGAVLMDDNLLSLDVVVPAGHPWLDGDDLGAVFDPIGQAWADALSDLGVPDVAIHRGAPTATRLGPAEQRPLAEVCYASLGRGEVTAGGRKLVGLSQRRRKQGALVQCGIHHEWAPDPLIEALDVGAARQAILDAATGLEDLIGPISDTVLIRAVQQRLTT